MISIMKILPQFVVFGLLMQARWALSQNSTASGTTTAPTMSITEAPPRPTCDLRNQQPGSGITARGCVCHMPDTPDEKKTFPLLTIKDASFDSQSCDYSTWPGTNVENPITTGSETITFSNRCEQCVKPVGNAYGSPMDDEHCDPIPGCWVLKTKLADTNIIIGDVLGDDGGKGLRSGLIESLKGSCPNEKTCSGQNYPVAEIDQTIVRLQHKEVAKLQMDVIESNFQNETERDLMFNAAVATWHQASAHEEFCGDVLEVWKVNLQQRCPDDKRNLPGPESNDESLEVSPLKPRLVDPPNTRECTRKHKMCSVPDHITVEYGPADEVEKSEMVIEVKLTLDSSNEAINKFFCSLIVAGLAGATAPYLAPMLGPAAGLPGVINFSAMCDEDSSLQDWFTFD